MKARFLAVAAIVLFLGDGPAQDDAAKKELDGLAGDWRLISGEDNGEPANDYALENLKSLIKGDQLTFAGIKPLTDRASRLTIKLDLTTTPKCIDLKVEEGSLKDQVLEGIYERKGDELKLCLYFGKGNRPLEFETKPGTDRVLFVLKREKK